jgi:hypothetical protein
MSRFEAISMDYSQTGVIPINTVLLQNTLGPSPYNSVSIQCVSMGTTGVVTPEVSNDGVTWVTATILTPGGATATTFNAAGIWVAVVNSKFFRLRLSTATTAGTTTISLCLLDHAPPLFIGTQTVSGTVSANSTETALVTPSTVNVNSAATTNATVIKGSAGNLYSVAVSNINAAARFLKLYNKATSPTVGTDVPVLTIPVPANTVVSVQFGRIGHRFSSGIGIAMTVNAADSDTTAVAANEIKASLGYI